MSDLTKTEQALASLFAAVSARVPEDPVDPWAAGARARYGESPGLHEARRWHRVSLAIAIALAMIASGTAAAAAAGAFPFSLSSILGAGGLILGSAHPQAVKGAVVQASDPGPDNTVLQVTSAAGANNAYHVAFCDTLTITTSQGAPAPGYAETDKGSCSIVGTEAGPLSPQQQSQGLGGGEAVTTWLAPSGIEYTIIFGEGYPGTSSVALTNSGGRIGAEVAARNQFFALYLPTSLYIATYNDITFFDAGGKSLGSLPG